MVHQKPTRDSGIGEVTTHNPGGGAQHSPGGHLGKGRQAAGRKSRAGLGHMALLGSEEGELWGSLLWSDCSIQTKRSRILGCFYLRIT